MTVTSSYRPTARKTLARSWKPSGRARAHRELDVDLGGDAYGDAHGWADSASSHGVRGPLACAAACARRSARTPRPSATRRGPAARRRRRPARPRRRRPTRPIRRARRAASCGAGRRPRRRPRRPRAAVAVVLIGSARRTRETSPQSTFGAGQKTLRPMDAGPLDLGVPVGLHRRHAVDLVAGRGGEPVGDLGLHHHQGALDASGSVSSMCSRTGTATLYGRFATSAVGRRARQLA